MSLSPWLAKVGQMSLFYQQLFIAADPVGHSFPAELPEIRQGDHIPSSPWSFSGHFGSLSHPLRV